MASKSFAWQHRLAEEVADAATIDVPTIGFQTPENYKTAETGVIVDGTVMAPEQATVAWAGDFAKATVTNSSGKAWEPGQTIYLTVPGLVTAVSDVADVIKALDSEVSGLETRMSTLEARVAAIEGALITQTSTNNEQGNTLSEHATAINDLDARVKAIEDLPNIPPLAGTASAPDKARAKHAESRPVKEEEEPEHAEHAEHVEHAEHAEHERKKKDKPGTPHWEDEDGKHEKNKKHK